jgi:hypothetical protein
MNPISQMVQLPEIVVRYRPASHDAHLASVLVHIPPVAASPPTQVQVLVAIDVLLTLYDPVGTPLQSLCPVASWYSSAPSQASEAPPAHMNPIGQTMVAVLSPFAYSPAGTQSQYSFPTAL